MFTIFNKYSNEVAGRQFGLNTCVFLFATWRDFFLGTLVFPCYQNTYLIYCSFPYKSNAWAQLFKARLN